MVRHGMLVVAVSAFCCMTTSCASLGSTKATVPEVERRLDSVLPTGTTRQEIETWLASQGMGFSYSENPVISSDLRQVPDIDKYHGAIVSIVHDTDCSLFVSESIQLYFLLDGEGRLASRVVKRVLTGP